MNGSARITFKKLLLSSTAISRVLLVGGAFAAASVLPAVAAEITGTTGTPAPAAATTANFQNDTATTTNDATSYDANGNATIVAGSTVANDATVFIYDSATGGQTTTVGTLSITSGKTLTVTLGAPNSTAIANATSFASVDFGGVISGSGNLTVGVATPGIDLGGVTQIIDFSGAANAFGTLIVNGGSAAGGFSGAKVTVTDLSTTSMTATTATITGGSGSALAADPGGLMTITNVTGTVAVSGTYSYTAGAGGATATGAAAGAGGQLTLTEHAGAVSGGTYTISGGAGGTGSTHTGGTDGAGGLAVVSAHAGAVSSTTLNLKSGTGGAGAQGDGGAGGALTITGFSGAITSTTTNITAGNGGAGLVSVGTGDGGAGGQINTSAFTSAITSTGGLNITSGSGGVAGAGTAAAGGDGGAGGVIQGLTFGTGTITAPVTITAGAGSSGGTSGVGIGGAGGAGGAITVTAFNAAVVGNMSATGGAGGSGSAGAAAIAGADAAVGGKVTVSDIATSLQGNLSLTGGAGGSGSAAGTGAVGGAGADGGLVLFSDINAFTGAATSGGSITMTAGAGGNAGASASGHNGGAAGAGGNVTITKMTSTPDVSTLSMTGGAGGNGSAGGAATAGIAGGTAGTATFAMTPAAKANITTITLTGGSAGNGGAAGTSGAGGAGTVGGSSTFTFTGTLTAQDDTGATAITLTGGHGGDGGAASTAVTGVAGVAGGAATLNLASSTTTANIILDDGTAGTAGASATGFAGGAAGAGGSATVNFTTGANTLTGNITAASNNEGTITSAGGKLTITGNIGTSVANVNQVTVGHANGLDITGNIYAKDLTLNVAGAQLNFSGTSEQIVAAAIGQGGNGTEDITMGANAIVTFNAAVGKTSAGVASALVDVTTSAGSTVKFNSTLNSVTLTLNATGKTTFEDAVTLTGALAAANGTTITLGKGLISGETAITYAAGASPLTTALTVNMPQTFTSGTITLLSNTTVGTNSATADAIIVGTGLQSNVLATYTAAADAGNDKVNVTAVKKSSSTIASSLGVTVEQAVALDNSNTAVATGDATAYTALNSALVTGGATAKKAAETLAVQSDILGAGAAASISTGGQVLGVASDRLAMMRSGEQFAGADQTGFASGDGAMSKAAWLKPFGNWATQDTHNGVKGYDANTYGISAGLDAKVNDKSRVGASLTYADTNIDGDGTGKAKNDIRSYQLTVYGDYTTDKYYVEGSLGYARNQNETRRTITVGSLVRTAEGSYDANQYMANINGGMPMRLQGESFFTPTAGISYTHVSSDSYTETGANNWNMRINPDDVDALILAVGGKLHTKIKQGKGYLIPMVRAGLTYDVIGDDASVTAQYTGGGAAFKANGAEVAQLGGNVGTGLTYDDGAWSIGASYDLDVKEDFLGHSGMLEMRWKF